MSPSNIEWTEQTWNPIVGCSVVSPGCTNCYAMRQAARLEAMGSPIYRGLTETSKAGPVWRGKVEMSNHGALTAPLRRRKPTLYFVNSMGDLFHEAVPDAWIDQVFAVMALAPQHTFQVLTKRSGRMRAYFDRRPHGRWMDQMKPIGVEHRLIKPAHGVGLSTRGMALRNVWLGVSAEDQRRADERIPDLLATPAAVRFVSCEPLLGPVDLAAMPFPDGDPRHRWDALTGQALAYAEGVDGHPDSTIRITKPIKPRLDWVIAGGESGPNARAPHPDWFRSLRDQCAAAEVPFFFKQWGAWRAEVDRDQDDPDWRADYSRTLNDGEHNIAWLNIKGGRGFHGERFHVMRRVRDAGRLLDGREHNDMPVTRSLASGI